MQPPSKLIIPRRPHAGIHFSLCHRDLCDVLPSHTHITRKIVLDMRLIAREKGKEEIAFFLENRTHNHKRTKTYVKYMPLPLWRMLDVFLILFILRLITFAIAI
jgi:hypothetical protein